MSGYVVPRHTRIGLTNIFVFDASAGTYTECIGAVPPYNLLPPVPAIGDIVYFGINIRIADEYPKCIVFDLIAGSDYTAVVEYYTGGAWVVGTFFDTTNTLKKSEDGSITYDHYTNVNAPASVAINGITGYWIRLRVTAIGGAPLPPIQVNRQVYACERSFIDIKDVPGDVDALSRLQLMSVAARPSVIVCGLRSLQRGMDFSSYIHFDTTAFGYKNRPPGVTVAFVAPSTPSTATAGFSPVRQSIGYAPLGAAGMTKIAQITIDPDYSEQWIGRYYPFLVGYQHIGGISGWYRIDVAVGNVTNTIASYTSRGKFTDMFLRVERIVNFSELVIPERAANAYIYISIYADIQNPQINTFHSLVLIPTDENFIEIAMQDEQMKEYFRNLSLLQGESAISDTIVNPKKTQTIAVDVNGNVKYSMFTKAVDKPIIHAQTDQRLWFFSFFYSWHVGEYKTLQHYGYRVSLEHVARYFSGRGQR